MVKPALNKHLDDFMVKRPGSRLRVKKKQTFAESFREGCQNIKQTMRSWVTFFTGGEQMNSEDSGLVIIERTLSPFKRMFIRPDVKEKVDETIDPAIIAQQIEHSNKRNRSFALANQGYELLAVTPDEKSSMSNKSSTSIASRASSSYGSRSSQSSQSSKFSQSFQSTRLSKGATSSGASMSSDIDPALLAQTLHNHSIRGKK